jgi:hypothetical protein
MNRLKYNFIYFTNEIYVTAYEDTLRKSLEPYTEDFHTMPGLLVPESRKIIESMITEIFDNSFSPLLFIGAGLNGYWANWFANSFLSPRILFNPLDRPFDFFQQVGDESNCEWSRYFVEFIENPYNLPGLILWNSPFNHCEEFSSMFQTIEINDGNCFDLKEESLPKRLMLSFIADLEKEIL